MPLECLSIMAGPDRMANAMDDQQPLSSPGHYATSIRSYLKHAEECMKEAQKMTSPSLGSTPTKFNDELCKYLAEKLHMAVQSARFSIEQSHGTCFVSPSGEMAKPSLKVFKRFLAIAKEVERFIQGCCNHGWIHAAITSIDMLERVSSLGFELELYRIVLSNSKRRLTLTEIHNVKKAEVEVVREKASLDKETSLKTVEEELRFVSIGEKDMADFLLEKLNPARRLSPHPSNRSSKLKIRSEGLLGRGATATVYKVDWLGHKYAKKTFCGPAKSHFMREVELLIPLAHSNVMTLLDVGESIKSCYIIMELMEGDLHDLMQQRSYCVEAGQDDFCPFNIMEAIDIMLQLGEGMLYLHENNIVHWDLKSANILVKGFKAQESISQIRVSDYGMLKTKRACKTFADIHDCNRWMAPEVIHLRTMKSHISMSDSKKWVLPFNSDEDSLKFPHKIDVYSFGMVAYEVLTGHLPFPTISEPSVVKKVMNGDRPVLPRYIPKDLQDLIGRCWNAKPSRRPSFAEICADLRYIKYLSLCTSPADFSAPICSALDIAGPSWSVPLEKTIQLKVQPQQCWDDHSASSLPITVASIRVPDLAESSQKMLLLPNEPQQYLEDGAASTTFLGTEKAAPILISEEAGSSQSRTFQKVQVTYQQQRLQQLEDGASTTFQLMEKTAAIPTSEVAKSSQCSSYSRALTRSYHKPKKLGRGASATVFKVNHQGREVAKKVFFGLDHPEFENEVAVLKPLSHPSIMSLLGYGRENDNCYMLMELMDGDLLQQMELMLEINCGHCPFAIPEAVGIMLQLAEGMKYLHENKIVHGDLKSPNILIKWIMENGLYSVDARVADFGLAKTNKKSRTYSDQVFNIGTDRWMAPELIKFPHTHGDQRNKRDNEKTLRYPYKIDVHSYAIICYEILTGKRPFPTIGSSKEVRRKVLNGDRPGLPHHCPMQLKNLIERCWNQDPSSRPTFADIVEELKKIQMTCLQETGIARDVHIVGVAPSYTWQGMESSHGRTTRELVTPRRKRLYKMPKRNSKLVLNRTNIQKRFVVSTRADSHVHGSWSWIGSCMLIILLVLLCHLVILVLIRLYPI